MTQIEMEGRLEAARRGSERAFAELYNGHLPALTCAVRRIVGADHALIADLVQETWLRAWQNLHRFRGDSSLGTWLHRIATNVALSHVRKKRVDVVAEPRVLQRLTSGQSDRPELRIDLQRALDAIPAGMRRVLWLHDVEGWTHREIGEAMGISDGTSKSQLCRARARLRARLEARPGAGPVEDAA